MLKAIVLVLAPALARGLSIRHLEHQSAIVNVPIVHAEGALASPDLTFRFDVGESPQPCGDANVAVEGKKLPESGSGSLSTSDGRAVGATWNVSCVVEDAKPKEQLISIGIDSVEGKAVVDVRFSVQFRQVIPVKISDVDGSATWNRETSLGASSDEVRTDDFTPDDAARVVEDELTEIEKLKKQVADLEHQIAAKEQLLAESFAWKEREEQSASVEKCLSFKCIVDFCLNKITDLVKKVHEAAGGHATSHNHTQASTSHSNFRPPTGQQQPVSIHSAHGSEHPMGSAGNHAGQPASSERLSHGPGRQSPHRGFQTSFFDSIPTPVKLIILGSLILIAFLIIAGHTRKHRDMRRTERRARRWEARRHCFRSRCNSLRNSINNYSARMSARFTRSSNDNDHHVSPSFVTAAHTPHPVDPPSDSESDTTMEETFASFRTIANVVGDIVAAEEGHGDGGGRRSLENIQLERQQRRWRPERHPPPPLPLLPEHRPAPALPSPTGAFPDYPSEDESLPEYYDGRTSLSAETQLVTDGFRYTPGSSSYNPSSSPPSSGADDVLGDSKL